MKSRREINTSKHYFTIYSCPATIVLHLLHSHHQEDSKLASRFKFALLSICTISDKQKFSVTLYKMPGLQDFFTQHLGHEWVFVDVDAPVSLVSPFTGTHTDLASGKHTGAHGRNRSEYDRPDGAGATYG